MREIPQRSTMLETIYNTECQEELQLESIQMFLRFRRIPEFSAYFHHTRGGFQFWPHLYSLPYSLSFSQNHIIKITKSHIQEPGQWQGGPPPLTQSRNSNDATVTPLRQDKLWALDKAQRCGSEHRNPTHAMVASCGVRGSLKGPPEEVAGGPGPRHTWHMHDQSIK